MPLTRDAVGWSMSVAFPARTHLLLEAKESLHLNFFVFFNMLHNAIMLLV